MKFSNDLKDINKKTGIIKRKMLQTEDYNEVF